MYYVQVNVPLSCLGIALAGVGAVPALGVVEEQVQRVGPRTRPVAHAHLHEHPEQAAARVRVSSALSNTIDTV